MNDLQYGGRIVDSGKECDTLNLMIEAMQNSSGSIEKKAPSLSDFDVVSAKRACQCCREGRDGITKAFTPAQLLQEGHTIYLHALRYRVKILSKKRSSISPSGEEFSVLPLAELCFDVGAPPWAEVELKDLDWLSG